MKVEKDVAGSADSQPILSDRKGSLKVTITPAQHKTLTHLPKRPPVDLAFSDLTYRVQEGKKSIVVDQNDVVPSGSAMVTYDDYNSDNSELSSTRESIIESSDTDSDKDNAFREDLKKWALVFNISHQALKSLSGLVNKRLPNIVPNDPRTLLRTNNIDLLFFSVGTGKYWHNGLTLQLKETLEHIDDVPHIISLVFNIDGLPLYKSSRHQVWPILCQIYEKRHLSPIVVGIYEGTGKPSDLEAYLTHLVTELKNLLQNPMEINTKKGLQKICTIQIKAFICDSPARALIKDVKTILKSVSGRLRSGELTAIMGPSGAGKSTLLNILTGYRTSGMEGSITVNGMERNLSTFRKLSCYIMQDNQLHGNLTVEEAMSVATALKLPSATTRADKEEVIQEILETLGLSEHHKTMTSNLSGGQKKRLSIALELVNNPPIMFFDEPTSGLDSSSCFQCISLLKTLARGGRTIICTIHQPSARLFEMFDHLYTLADGQCVYQGSTGRLVEWLGSLSLQCPSYHNPASFIIEVSCGEYGDNTGKLVRAIDNGKHDIRNGVPFPDSKVPDFNNKKDMEVSLNSGKEWNKNDLAQVPEKFKAENVANGNGTGNLHNGILQYAASELSKGKGEPLVVQIETDKQDNAEVALLGDNGSPKRYATSELTQFWVVLKRTLLFSRRDWTLMYLRLFAHILVGFLIGALYYDIGDDGSKVLSNLGFLFFNMLFLMYTSMTITILSFPLEMPVLVKEHFNRWYSLRSYYLAITVSDLPFQAIFCVIYVVIVYLLTSQPLDWCRFAMFLSSCLLISFVAQSVGLVVGAAMNVQNGVFLAPVMSVPFLLFSGFFVSFNAIPVYLRWITYLSYIRYGFEGTALATYSFDRPNLQCHQPYCHFKHPDTTLEELDMKDADFTLDIAALCLIFFVLRVSAFLFLRWKLKSSR